MIDTKERVYVILILIKIQRVVDFAECLGEGTFGKVHSAIRSWQDFPTQITSSFLYDDHISNRFPL
jgi:hypothetical protein